MKRPQTFRSEESATGICVTRGQSFTLVGRREPALHLLLCVPPEPLLAGLPQTVKFTLLTGHYAVRKGDALQLSNSDGMPVLAKAGCTARISNSGAGTQTPRPSVPSARSRG